MARLFGGNPPMGSSHAARRRTIARLSFPLPLLLSIFKISLWAHCKFSPSLPSYESQPTRFCDSCIRLQMGRRVEKDYKVMDWREHPNRRPTAWTAAMQDGRASQLEAIISLPWWFVASSLSPIFVLARTLQGSLELWMFQ